MGLRTLVQSVFTAGVEVPVRLDLGLGVRRQQLAVLRGDAPPGR